MAKRLSGDRNAVFAAIMQAAEKGVPCPTNRELTMIGRGGQYFGSDSIRAFTKAGLIEVETFANARRVTIIKTGKRTHYERGYEPLPDPVFVPKAVDRTPCPRCGTRKDIGCVHQRPDGDPVRITTFPHVRGLR